MRKRVTQTNILLQEEREGKSEFWNEELNWESRSLIRRDRHLS